MHDFLPFHFDWVHPKTSSVCAFEHLSTFENIVSVILDWRVAPFSFYFISFFSCYYLSTSFPTAILYEVVSICIVVSEFIHFVVTKDKCNWKLEEKIKEIRERGKERYCNGMVWYSGYSLLLNVTNRSEMSVQNILIKFISIHETNKWHQAHSSRRNVLKSKYQFITLAYDLFLFRLFHHCSQSSYPSTIRGYSG